METCGHGYARYSCDICNSKEELRKTKRQLEAAKQRELELLAVIESVKGVLRDYGMYEVADLLLAEPSQALREHEAKVLEEAAEWFAANHVVMLQKGLLHSEELRRMAEERRKK